MKKVAATVTGAVLAFMLLLGVPVVLTPANASGPAGLCTIDGGAIASAGEVAGYEGEQLTNAVAIMNAATSLGLGVRGQQIGVMTAMEESTLQNLTYGDNAVNPDGSIADSIGLFQQQGSWGSLDERLDPSTAARLFFERMATLPGWETMEPADVAHAIQVNDRADRYEAHWTEAVEVVHALTGLGNCTTAAVSAGGGALPATDVVTSSYGWRVDPISGERKFHRGLDFSGGCGAPIYAAANGVVTRIFEDDFGAWIIEVDHGDGAIAWYVHMYTSGIHVTEGQALTAGQQIGAQGSSGYSTGCHLHFEVRVDGQTVSPLEWLAARGVQLPAA